MEFCDGPFTSYTLTEQPTAPDPVDVSSYIHSHEGVHINSIHLTTETDCAVIAVDELPLMVIIIILPHLWIILPIRIT